MTNYLSSKKNFLRWSSSCFQRRRISILGSYLSKGHVFSYRVIYLFVLFTERVYSLNMSFQLISTSKKSLSIKRLRLTCFIYRSLLLFLYKVLFPCVHDIFLSSSAHWWYLRIQHRPLRKHQLLRGSTIITPKTCGEDLIQKEKWSTSIKDKLYENVILWANLRKTYKKLIYLGLGHPTLNCIYCTRNEQSSLPIKISPKAFHVSFLFSRRTLSRVMFIIISS